MTFPNETGISISDLKVGQIIEINGKQHTVIAIDGYSGMCSDGTLLNCLNQYNIVATEEFSPEIVLEDKATEILNQIGILELVENHVREYNSET